MIIFANISFADNYVPQFSGNYVAINISSTMGIISHIAFRNDTAQPWNLTNITINTSMTNGAGNITNSTQYVPTIVSKNITQFANGTLIRVEAIKDANVRIEVWYIYIPNNDKELTIMKTMAHRQSTPETLTNQNTYFTCASNCVTTGPYWNNKTVMGGDIKGLNFQIASSNNDLNLSVFASIANYTTFSSSGTTDTISVNWGSNIDGGIDYWRYIITPVSYGDTDSKYSYPFEYDHNLTTPELIGLYTNWFHRNDRTLLRSWHSSFVDRRWLYARFGADEWTTAGFTEGYLSNFRNYGNIEHLIYAMLIEDVMTEYNLQYFDGGLNAGDYAMQRLHHAWEIYDITGFNLYKNTAVNSTIHHYNDLTPTNLGRNSTGCTGKVWIDGAARFSGFIRSATDISANVSSLVKERVLNETLCQLQGLPYGSVDSQGYRIHGWYPPTQTWASGNDTSNNDRWYWVRGEGWIHQMWRPIAEAMALNQTLFTNYDFFVSASINLTRTLINYTNPDGSAYQTLNQSGFVKQTNNIMWVPGMVDMILTNNMTREKVLQPSLDILCWTELNTIPATGSICAANTNGIENWKCGQSYNNGPFPEAAQKLSIKEVLGRVHQSSPLTFNKTTLICGYPGQDFNDSVGNKLGMSSNLLVYNLSPKQEVTVEGNKSNVRFRMYVDTTIDYNVSFFTGSNQYITSTYSRSDSNGLLQFKANITNLTRINLTDQGVTKGYSVFNTDESLFIELYPSTQTDAGLVFDVHTNSSYGIKNISLFINSTINQTVYLSYLKSQQKHILFRIGFEQEFLTDYPIRELPLINNVTWINDPTICPVGNGCIRSWNRTSKLIYAPPPNLSGQSKPAWANLTGGAVSMVFIPQQNYKDSGDNFNQFWLKSNTGPTQRQVMSRWSNNLEGFYWFINGTSTDTGGLDRDTAATNKTLFYQVRWCNDGSGYQSEIWIDGLKHGTTNGVLANMTNDTLDNIAIGSSEIDNWGANEIIDEFVVWNHCLTDKEMQDNYYAFKYGNLYNTDVNVSILIDNVTSYTINSQANSYIPSSITSSTITLGEVIAQIQAKITMAKNGIIKFMKGKITFRH